MLKLTIENTSLSAKAQPPSGGCVLKRRKHFGHRHRIAQPPSGGCVLKLGEDVFALAVDQPAAFGRLCVETWPARNSFNYR